jgi:hypothetical protein
MKKNFLPVIALIVFITGGLSGCRKLDTPIESQYTPITPVTQADYTAALGAVYSQLADNPSGTRYAVEYWRMQELSTDEAIIPARGGNYDDGGQYRFLHLHTWSADHPNVISVWQWGFQAINTCNTLLQTFAPAANTSMKASAIAEARAMRALFYFFMMDLYGNVPIIDTLNPNVQAPTALRPKVFQFIEGELKAILPTLPTATGQATYGHATKWMAFALLEKMYLNAQVYTGASRYTDAVAMADSILTSSPYSLDASYGSVFAPTNGPQTKETIFAIPYDANYVPGNQLTRYGFAAYVYPLYGLPKSPSVAMSTDSSFYAHNFVLPGDIRDTFWIRGPQFYFPGQAINTSLYPAALLPYLQQLYPKAIYPATNATLDASYSGSSPGALNLWQITIRDSLVVKGDPAKMDIGNDILAQNEGIRSKKFYPDPNENPQTQDQNNDVPIFRLADVLLMKAEALFRGGIASTTVKGEVQTPVVLTNKIRARVGAQLADNSLTVDSLLSERAREFAWEGWRRNDLIRFGAFEGAWGFKTADAGPTRQLYPVPNVELSLNTKLVQNQGY